MERLQSQENKWGMFFQVFVTAKSGPGTRASSCRTETRESQLPRTASAHSIRRQISVACQSGASASSVTVLPEKR